MSLLNHDCRCLCLVLCSPLGTLSVGSLMPVLLLFPTFPSNLLSLGERDSALNVLPLKDLGTESPLLSKSIGLGNSA